MSDPPSPQTQGPPSWVNEHPGFLAIPAAESANNSDQPQSQPQVEPQPIAAPDSTKFTPSDADQGNKRIPNALSLRPRTVASDFKGTRADAIGAFEDYREYIETVITELGSDPPNIAEATRKVKEIGDTLDEDIIIWCNAMTEASMPPSTYARPIPDWLAGVLSGKPAEPSPFQPSQAGFPEATTPRSTEALNSTEASKSTETQVHWPESGGLQRRGEQVIDSFCQNTGRSDRIEAKGFVMQIWSHVRGMFKRHHHEEQHMRNMFVDRVGGECYEKLLLLDELCLKEEERIAVGKDTGEDE